MPELPEVETIRRGLVPRLAGKALRALDLFVDALRVPVPRERLADLVGRRLRDIDRRGKWLIFRFSARRGEADAPTLVVHLGMSGAFRFESTRFHRRRHDHAVFRLGGQTLVFSDPRRFGVLDRCDGDPLERYPAIATLGPEPLSADFSGAVLAKALCAGKRRLRDALLDGRVVAGIGNIYANEACALIGVRPSRRARTLTAAQFDALADALVRVLGASLEAGGSTLADGRYRDGEGLRGRYQVHFEVYGRAGEPCRRCAAPIKRVAAMSRGAFYCPRCQR